MIGSIEDALRDMGHGIYDFAKHGKCSGCGNCCSNILPLSEIEIKQIKEYVHQNNIQEIKRAIYVTAVPTIDFQCPFLDESKDLKCTIYPVRPQICREFICNQGRSFTPSKQVLDGRHPIRDVRKTFFAE